MNNMTDEQINSKFKEMQSRMIIYHNNYNNNVKSDINYMKEFLDFSIKYNKDKEIDYLTLTIDEFRKLKNDYYNILNKCKISIFMEHVNDISLSELQELKKKFNVNYISIKDLHSLDESYQLSVGLIYKYKKAIQKITEGIDNNFLENKEDREKIIFGILISRILENTEYDLTAQEEYEKKSKVTRLGKHYDCMSNEMLGLIKGKCVCRGYAGIVRDVFRSVDISVNVITGMSEHNGHAWNQIKLDGEWYNIDVTWDKDYILNEGKSYWLLKDDYRFEMGYLIRNENGDVTELSHRIFSINRTPGNTCTKTLSDEELSKYLNFSDLRKKNWLTNTLKNINLKQIRISANKLFFDMTNAKNQDHNNLKR